ncbi:MAG TPA: tripartite tricarboxylate transporter substrate-binding protein [Chloroflexota bacterium]|nr:tripartite tricarboxylate transporter substrate-binding protein [Chloroflexota bacterium]
MRTTLISVCLGIAVMALLVLAGCSRAATPTGSGAGGQAAGQPPAQGGSQAAGAAAGDEREVASFYRGKTVRLVVGYDAGGGYDTYSRVIAKYIGKYIPGNPTVIVENRPGAGGLVATNYLANAAPKDGTVLLNVGASSMLKQLAGDRGVEYDASKFQYLGAPFSDHNVLVVRKQSGFTRLDEIFGPNSRQMVLGGISPGSPQDVEALVLRDTLGGNVKLVSGYDGTSKIRLAIGQGEIDGFFNSWESLRATSRAEIDSGELVVLAQLVEQPLADFPGVPTLFQFARTDEQRQFIRLAAVAPLQFARPYFVAQDVPEARVRALRSAFDRTLADAEFLANAERSKLDLEPITGDRLQALVTEFLNMPPALKSEAVKIYTAP